MFLFVIGILMLALGIGTHFYFRKDIKSRNKRIADQEKKLELNGSDMSNYTRSSIEEIIERMSDANRQARKILVPVRLISIILAVLFIALSMVTQVPTGYTGIKTTFGKVENETLPSGINFKMPWQNVINMDNREQRSPFAMQAFSKDIQQVDVQGSINMNIDKNTAMNLYKDVGIDYSTILVGPRVQEDVKIVIAKYTAENLVENRQRASDEIFELVRNELKEKGINVISFAIENLDFTDAFESAVEAKQVATQEKQKAQTEQERQTMEMQQKAERDRIQAQAAADVQKIEADAKAYALKVQADAEAEANKKVAETLSDSLIRYNTVHQWDGKLPTVQSGEYSTPIIDLRNTVE